MKAIADNQKIYYSTIKVAKGSYKGTDIERFDHHY
jgi:hypothetical protein